MSRCALLMFFLTVVMVNGAIKKWLPSVNFDDTHMWAYRRCRSYKIDFRDLKIPLLLTQNFTTQEFILPTNGIILIPELDHNLVLIDLVETDEYCEHGGIFFGDSLQPVLDSKNWETIEDGVVVEHSTAMPHREMIPCANDLLEFPGNGSTFGMDFQYMSHLKIRGFKDFENFDIQRFLATDIGQSVFKNSEDTIFEMTNELSDDVLNSCYHKSANFDNTNDILCHNEGKNCEVPLCLEPVRPIGHCCDICGAIMYVAMEEESQTKNAKKIIDRVKKRLNSDYDYMWLHYHGSVVPKDGGISLQLIFVDYDTYFEFAPGYAKRLKNELFDLIYPSYKVNIVRAGKPYTPFRTGHVALFIFGCLFLISILFTIIFAAFDEKIQKLLKLDGVFRRHFFTSPFVFARFDNTEDNADGGITVGLDAASEINLQANLGETNVMSSRSTGFNNPMYNKDDIEIMDNVKMIDVNQPTNAGIDSDNEENNVINDNTPTIASNEETILVDVDLIEN